MLTRQCPVTKSAQATNQTNKRINTIQFRSITNQSEKMELATQEQPTGRNTAGIFPLLLPPLFGCSYYSWMLSLKSKRNHFLLSHFVWYDKFTSSPGFFRLWLCTALLNGKAGLSHFLYFSRRWRDTPIVFSIIYSVYSIYLFFIARGREGADGPEAMYYLCFILKNMLQKSCPKYNCQINCSQLHV
jgi:hypothetical protein